MSKKKREKVEDFIGWKSDDGLLDVVDFVGIKDKWGKQKFKVICHKCKEDRELFPQGYFISMKSSLIKGSKPCGCAKNPQWEDWQFLILANRVAKGRFIVHGFAEEFHGQKTKVICECIIDGYRWLSSIDKIINGKYGCAKCSNNYKPTEQEALQKCIDICDGMDYNICGFVDGYKNVYSRFEYDCPIHGIQNVSYNDFVNGAKRCRGCGNDKNMLRALEFGYANGYYPYRKYEQDYLYVLDFNNKYIKVGRSFNVSERLKTLRTSSKIPIKRIYKLRVFTATHQEIYDLEQELHNELRDRNFQYYVDWSNECFENHSLFILNKLLDNCGLEEVTCG
jgi:hypothetical protein